MAEAHGHVRRGAVSDGSEMPRRKARQSVKAVGAEPAVQVSRSSKPEIVGPVPARVEAITIPSPVTSQGPVPGLAQERPVSKSSTPIVKLGNSPVAAANLAPEYLKSLARERIELGVAVAVSWAVIVVALLRITGHI